MQCSVGTGRWAGCGIVCRAGRDHAVAAAPAGTAGTGTSIRIIITENRINSALYCTTYRQICLSDTHLSVLNLGGDSK